MKGLAPYSIKKIIPAYVGAWLLIALMQSVILHRLHLPWSIAVQDASISAGLLGLACFLTITLFYYYQPGRKNRMNRFGFALALAIIFCVIIHWLLKFIYADTGAGLEFLEASMPVRFVVSFLILCFITMLNWLWSSLQDQKEQQQRASEAEQLVKDAELAKLRQQLQPHFLFNSLNSISALAGTKPQEARKMIQQLSDFLRGTLKKDEQKTVPMKEELEHLRLYLEIEKVRFGHRLRVEIDTAEASLGMLLPPLVLQPIVENAIKFGLYDTIGEITIRIISSMEANQLILEVQNPFDKDTQLASKGTGFGLSSVQRRLFLLYGRNDLLSTEKKEELFITRIKIPQQL